MVLKRLIVAAIAACVLLGGCSAIIDMRDNEETLVSSDRICFYTDPDTGVQYVVYRGVGIFPRYNADGTLYVVEVDE